MPALEPPLSFPKGLCPMDPGSMDLCPMELGSLWLASEERP